MYERLLAGANRFADSNALIVYDYRHSSRFPFASAVNGWMNSKQVDCADGFSSFRNLPINENVNLSSSSNRNAQLTTDDSPAAGNVTDTRKTCLTIYFLWPQNKKNLKAFAN